MIRSIFNTVDICCEGSVDFQDMSRFAAWNFTSISLLLFVAAVRHDADNAYSMQITWLCIRLFPFLTVAYNDIASLEDFPYDRIPEHITTLNINSHIETYQYTAHVSEGAVANVGNNPTVVKQYGVNKVNEQRQNSDNTESVGNSDVVGGYNLRKEFGEKWYEPKGLVLRPLYIVDQFNTTLVIERNLEVILKLQFFNDLNAILKHENLFASLSGYAIFDFDLKDLRPGNDMNTHAALLSKFQFTIIELADDERYIEEAKRKLARITCAIRKHIKFNVPVKSVVFFPCSNRLPSSFVCPNNSVLYKDELRKLLENILKQPDSSIEDTSNVKTALAEMIRITFFAQHHPKTVEEAVSRAALRLFMQSPGEKISEFSQIDFNSIKLTDFQHHIKNDLLASSTLVWGGYGIGKSVAIVSAIAESIKQYRSVKQSNREQANFKILLISAQGLLGDVDLKLSPFILMIEKWITDVCEYLGCTEALQVINYIHFLDRSIDFAIQSKVGNEKEIIFSSYLLKKADLKLMIENSWGFDNFDIIVLEETHALDSNVISDFVAGFQKAVRKRTTIKNRIAKVWITTNARRQDMFLPNFAVSPKSHNESKNMRNAPAVAKLAKAINTVIGPERYPSTAMPLSPIRCLINVTYQYDFNEKERFRKIVELAEKWRHCLPNSSVLFIDCEPSDLYEEFHTAGFPLKMYGDSYKAGEPLFLKHSDPIEAIVAGAEWHVLIVHIGINTLNTIRMTELFNKRIISRATAKIFIFSDNEIRDEEELKANEEPISNFGDENFEGTDIEPLHEPDNYISDDIEIADDTSYSYSSKNSGNESGPIEGFANLLENMRTINEEFTSDGKLSHYTGYDFIRIRNLDKSLRAVSQNIYLVHGMEHAFIVHLNSDTKDQVLKSQILLERVWKVQLSAYCDSKLVSPGKSDNLTCVSKLLYLLKPKVFSSMNDSIGFRSVGEEEVEKFSKSVVLQGQKKIIEDKNRRVDHSQIKNEEDPENSEAVYTMLTQLHSLGKKPKGKEEVVSNVKSEGDSEDIEESEELDWRLKAIVIGMGSKGLLDLMLKTGAQVFTQGQSIFVHGNKKQRADLLDAVQRKTASVSTEVVEEVADYIPEGLLGLVIGKRHATIKKLERDTGALLTPRRGKITIKGTALQTRLGHAAIKEILAEASEEVRDEIIDYIPDHLIGVIIGKGGSMRRKIYEETKASFTVTPEGTLVLTGTQRQRKLALNLIQEILARASAKQEEVIDYIPENLISAVIGKGGSMQRMIYQQTGAWVRVSPEKLVLLHGSPQERKLGHAFIKYILAEASEEVTDEIIDYIPDHLIGVIIGKGGSMRRKIYEETEASFTVTLEGRLVLTGTQRQRKLALNLIQEILARASAKQEEVIDYIPENLISAVIGKGGSMQRMIYQQTGAWVGVSPEKLVLLHGSPQERKLGHAFIKDILEYSRIFATFATDETMTYKLQKIGQNSEGTNYLLSPEQPKHTFDLNYTEMKKLQNYLFEQIQKLNKDTKSQNGLGHLYLHIGKLIVQTRKEENPADVYKLGDILENLKRQHQPWNFKFQSAVAVGHLSLNKLASRINGKTYIRYDINIFSPTSKEFRYKVYMEEGEKALCTPEDLGISSQHFGEKVGPGFLWNDSRKLCRAEILLPKEFVARFNMNVARFLDYRQVLVDVRWDHSRACDILYPIGK